MTANRARVLAEVVSLDAWHEPLRADGSTTAVFVELSFHEGRLGGDDDDFPFTFNVNLKRALLTLSLEPPLELDRQTVARSIPEAQIELTRLRAAKESAIAKVGGSAKLSPAALHLALTGSRDKTSSVSSEDQVRIVQTVPEIMVNPRPKNNHSYSWELEPTYRSVLRGQPWNPVDPPRLHVKSLFQLPKIEPAIRVDMSCSLADVDITDLVPKRSDLTGKLANAVLGSVNVAAAVQHLKLVLRDADLDAGRLDNRFSDFLVASVISTPDA